MCPCALSVCCRYFTEAELADTERVVDVNVIGTVRMTHMVNQLQHDRHLWTTPPHTP